MYIYFYYASVWPILIITNQIFCKFKINRNCIENQNDILCITKIYQNDNLYKIERIFTLIPPSKSSK